MSRFVQKEKSHLIYNIQINSFSCPKCFLHTKYWITPLRFLYLASYSEKFFLFIKLWKFSTSCYKYGDQQHPPPWQSCSTTLPQTNHILMGNISIWNTISWQFSWIYFISCCNFSIFILVFFFFPVKVSWAPVGTFCYQAQCSLRVQCFYQETGKWTFFNYENQVKGLF